ncbi:hypothetical protein EXIGLDRAFT_836871 [Exidia glandulosa HHB12029]|uniref:Zn(2)-C6 fungal-type domain-containing protein n=1 Tax=Exidia glandulosa HHB12029 TaxID=1314781 RepID=A0A166AH54_EXIGL|nr:hypothetical protein EXIGLDRAFT_836871 [Exidia glandulosa HHB12029]
MSRKHEPTVNKACRACREAKVGCKREDVDGVCERCEQRQIECVTSKRKDRTAPAMPAHWRHEREELMKQLGELKFLVDERTRERDEARARPCPFCNAIVPHGSFARPARNTVDSPMQLSVSLPSDQITIGGLPPQPFDPEVLFGFEDPFKRRHFSNDLPQVRSVHDVFGGSDLLWWETT